MTKSIPAVVDRDRVQSERIKKRQLVGKLGIACSIALVASVAVVEGWPAAGPRILIGAAIIIAALAALFLARAYAERQLAGRVQDILGAVEVEVAKGRKLARMDTELALQPVQKAMEEALQVAQKALEQDRYQPFARSLTNEQIEVLQKTWAPALKLDTPKATALRYLASRVRMLEMLMRGRLAATIEDVLLRAFVAKSIKGDTVSILEIGTLFGVGAAALHEAIRSDGRRVHLTLLDPLDGYYGNDKPDTVTGASVSESVLRDNMEIARVSSDDWTLIKGLSTASETLEAAKAREYDLLIIDGDHSFEGVANDFSIFGPLVKVGGYVIFDDYGRSTWPGVTKYVDEEMPNCEWCRLVGANWHTAVYQVTESANRPSTLHSAARLK